jgi:predicted phosphodiesterase
LFPLGPIAAALAASAGKVPPAVVTIGPYVKAEDPHRLTVCWETASRTPTRLHWGTTADCPTAYSEPTPVKHHEAVISGLDPDRTYWYRLDDTAVPAIPFRTRGDRPDRVRIAVLGDTHSNLGAHYQIVAEMVAEKPDLVLHMGDLSVGRTESRLRDFFLVEAPVLRSVPIYPVLGNHDGSGSRFAELFLPKQDKRPSLYYSARWGSVAVIALDTNQAVGEKSEQWRWLSGTLQQIANDPSVSFKIVEMHWGPYDSGSGHGSNLEVRDALAPLFERYGVDIVFSGHDHTFERSTVKGVTYVVTGGGGGGGGKYGYKRHMVLGSWWTQVEASTYHHCLVEIIGATLSFTARETGTSRVIDEFALRK